MTTVVSDATAEVVQPRPALPPRTRAPRVVRTNRVIIGVIGLILLAAGVAGLLAAFGVFGSTLEDEAVLSGRVDRFTERQDWFWPALAALTGIIALLALWWLIAQLRTDRLRGIHLRPSGRDGQTSARRRDHRRDRGGGRVVPRSEPDTGPAQRDAHGTALDARGHP